MKQFTQLLTALVFCSLMIFVACNKSGSTEPDDPRDEVGAAIASKPWTAASVTLDGTTRTEWDGFTISFSYNEETHQGTYTVANVPSNPGASDVFGSGVTWTFDGVDENANTGVIVRSDGVNVNVSRQGTDPLAPTSLTLSFTITDASNRVAGFNGAWVFTLN